MRICHVFAVPENVKIPLVWYAVRKLFQDMEMYCDESVLEERTFQERKKYADILLKFAVRQSGLAKALWEAAPISF